MRWILIEHARHGATDKRGGGQVMLSLDDRIPDTAAVAMTTALALDKGLEALEAISPQRRQIVELRYFAGLQVNEIATLLDRSEEHTSELQSLMRISYAVFCLKKKKTTTNNTPIVQ